MSVLETHLKVTEDNKIRILNIYLRTVVRGLVGMPAPPHTSKEDLYKECKITPKGCCFTGQTASIVVRGQDGGGVVWGRGGRGDGVGEGWCGGGDGIEFYSKITSSVRCSMNSNWP